MESMCLTIFRADKVSKMVIDHTKLKAMRNMRLKSLLAEQEEWLQP